VDFIFGFDLNDEFNDLLLFPSKGQKILYKHFTVQEIFQYIGIFIFSCVFYKIERMTNKKEIVSHEVKSSSTIKPNNEIILIFNDSQDEIGNISNLVLTFILIYD